MENLDLNPLITALGGALVGATGIWVAIQRQKLKERQKNIQTADALLRMSEIYDCLNELTSETNADRALILFTSNGGGIPRASGIVNATILYELVTKHGLSPIRADFQHIPLDESYTKMLKTVILEGSLFGTPEDLLSGFLKTQYNDEGVKYFYLWELLRTPEKYFYGALRWNGETAPPKDQLKSYTSIQGSKIANLLIKDF